MSTPKTRVLTLLVVLFIVTLLAAGCGGAEPPAADDSNGEVAGAEPAGESDERKEPIVITDTQFQTLWINNAIAKFIIEEGYGYPVEIKTVSTPVFQHSLAAGDTDIHMELWRQNVQEWYDKETAAGNVIDLGTTYERSTQGWYVPRYVIEGDPERGLKPLAPDLKSVDDLPKYKEVFQDPEDPDKGQFVNCITGWQCATINRIKLEAYGLTDDYNVLEPGSAAALDAAIAGAYQKGKPILAYYWEPTWLLGTYDMVQLEEPEFNAACAAETQLAVTGEIDIADVGEEAGCAYESIDIHKGIHKSLKERAPEVVAFLEKMNVGTDPLNKTAAFMEAEEAGDDAAAIYFFENYQERWREWLPDEIEAKVEAALLAAGADL